MSFMQLLVELKFQLIPFCRTFLANVFLSVQLLNVLAFSIGPKAYAVLVVRVPSRVGPLRFYCSTATAHNESNTAQATTTMGHTEPSTYKRSIYCSSEIGDLCAMSSNGHGGVEFHNGAESKEVILRLSVAREGERPHEEVGHVVWSESRIEEQSGGGKSNGPQFENQQHPLPAHSVSYSCDKFGGVYIG